MRRLVYNTYKKALATLALLTLELVVVWGMLLLSFGIFIFFTKLVFIDKGTGFDEAAFAFADAHATPGLTRFMRFITFFASFPFLLGAGLSLAAYYLFIRKHKWYSLKIVTMALGGTLLNQGLKFFFERPRPTTEIENFSFPSGHTMIGLTFYGVLIYLAWKYFTNPVLRYLVCGFLLVLVLVISYSRIYLHVHYATDVVAGLAGGTAWLIVGIYVLNRLERYSRKEVDPVLKEPAPQNPAA